MFDDNSVDTVLYDPPYSVRQVSEVYRKLGQSVNMETTKLLIGQNKRSRLEELSKKMELLLVVVGTVVALVRNMDLKFLKYY